jgi:AcrR family transcriptional regulator
MWYMQGQCRAYNPAMAAPTEAPQSDARDRLLRATVDYVAEHGITDRSLRQIAAAIGTSHRMLVYHFGSKDGLLIEVVRVVEADQRAALEALAADASLDAATQAARLAKRLTDPRLRRNERLFFELYAQALQGRGPVADLLPELVHSWLAPLRMLSIGLGVPESDADAHGRLMLAVARGLLLDLVGTRERKAVDRAMELFQSMTESYVAALPRRSKRPV